MDNNNDEKVELKERDFHHGEGHTIPIIIKIAWAGYWIAAIAYLAIWFVPSLKEALSK